MVTEWGLSIVPADEMSHGNIDDDTVPAHQRALPPPNEESMALVPDLHSSSDSMFVFVCFNSHSFPPLIISLCN